MKHPRLRTTVGLAQLILSPGMPCRQAGDRLVDTCARPRIECAPLNGEARKRGKRLRGLGRGRHNYGMTLSSASVSLLLEETALDELLNRQIDELFAAIGRGKGPSSVQSTWLNVDLLSGRGLYFGKLY